MDTYQAPGGASGGLFSLDTVKPMLFCPKRSDAINPSNYSARVSVVAPFGGAPVEAVRLSYIFGAALVPVLVRPYHSHAEDHKFPASSNIPIHQFTLSQTRISIDQDVCILLDHRG